MSPPAEDDAPGAVTAVLQRVAEGDAGAAAELFPLLRAELHQLASAAMDQQAPGHTLQATALVHEAWLRLTKSNGVPLRNRRHFIGVAAKAMRSVLVDHARRAGTVKRGGGARVALTQELVDAYTERACDLVELDDALERLAQREPRLARVVELRFFAGLTLAQSAEVLELGTSTVERDWHLARIWLRRELGAA